MSSELLTLIFGIVALCALVTGAGYTILAVCQAQIRACERHSGALVESLRQESGARFDALRTEFHQRIENLRMETKDDRHNYVEKIDAVLGEMRGDIQDVNRSVAALEASVHTAMKLMET